MIYEQLRNTLIHMAEKNGLMHTEVHVLMNRLKPVEAIGSPDRKDFPLLKGKEVLVQANFDGVKGQAYTDAPSEFSASLKTIVDSRLEDNCQKASFVATFNAVMRYLDPSFRTVHCKNNQTEKCALKIKEFMANLGPRSLGLIGLQPAMLDAMVSLLGNKHVRCLDRDEDTRDQVRYGIPIEWGDDEGTEAVFRESDVVLATGSSVANGSLAHILETAERYRKPVYFYGTTIAGAARVLGLNHLCFEST